VKVPIPVRARLTIEQCLKTQEEIKDMECVPYEIVVGILMYCWTHLLHLEGGGRLNECGALFPKTSLLHKNSSISIQHLFITHCCHL
jgi:hypothetical protein